MATNVTEKDKTLNEIIGMCVEKRIHYRQFLNDFMLTHSEDWHDSADVTYGERITVYRLQCPRGHISTSWFSYPAYASRQWKELVDEYKGKDTK